MTTQHMHHEHSDADIHTPVAEGSSVSETVTDSTYQAEAPLAEGQADVQNESSAPQHEAISTPSATATPTETTPQASEQTQDNGVQSQVEEPDTTASEPNGGSTIEEPQRAEELEMRPFTSFIEEFQQEQARLNVPPAERETETIVAFSSEATPAPFLVPEFGAAWEQTVSPTPVTQASEAQQAGEIPEFLAALSEAATETPATGETTSTPEPGEAKHIQVNPEEAAPAAQTPAERPVSPLLRPASRIRVPRHHSRQREEAAQATQATQTPDSTEKQAQEESPLTTTTRAETATQAAATPEPAQPRPGRRYRFDRPAKNAVATTPPHSEEHKEAANRAVTTPPASTENGNGHTQPAQKHVVPAQPAETPTAKTDAATESASETTSGSQTQAATGEHEQHGRRRHSQERQREKEQAHATPAVTAPSTPTPVAEPVAQATPAAQAVEPPVVPAQPEEVNPEDLPPLEYADLQAANSRRRRRRRPTTPVGNTNTSAAAPSGNAPLAVKPVTPEVSAQGTPTVVPTPAPAPAAQVSAPPVTGPRATPTPGGQYNIVSGYTVSQMNQNGDGVGPFMGPDPSPARGSIPGHALRTGRAEVQRAPAYPPLRTEPSGASVNHLATVVAQAIQTQTDRMVAELRRANQGPTNVAVTLPPFPSTERVGVFVDVANLLYSARTMRINIDFGKLLDFLRGNRRLVRAQAYCPTSPQAGDEQMFLQAVKGLGYRITTKNYKTFSSGAKKADLDLDLCMDVVRLVDGRAVDCIVLVSGDSDFMPMLDYCSDHGVRVEVAAFDEAMSATLRQSCDLFINLSMLSEIRA